MDRRELFKAVIGGAVAAIAPSLAPKSVAEAMTISKAHDVPRYSFNTGPYRTIWVSGPTNSSYALHR